MASEGNGEFNSVIETLMNMFSDVLNKDAIIAIVESCGGDLNLSVEAVMEITNDGNTIQENKNITQKVVVADNNIVDNIPPVNQNLATNPFSEAIQKVSLSNTNQHSSYANISSPQPSSSQSALVHSSGAVPKVMPKSSPIQIEWNNQIRRIIENHNKGSRILVLMRGAPGSGKTHLAQKIVEMIIGGSVINFRTHICSTDDYFMSRGKYYFNKHNLSEAHAWNQNRTRLAMHQGLSPIIIDNTNIEIWEMEPYVRSGVQNGYILEVVEPNTPWAKKANQLSRKNIHNVPIMTIKRMLDNYAYGVTGESLLKYFNLTYPSNREPPVVRSMPEFQRFDTNSSSNFDNRKLILSNQSTDDTQTYLEQAQIFPVVNVQSTPSIQQNVEVSLNSVESKLSNTFEQLDEVDSATQISLNMLKTSPEPHHNEKTDVDQDFEVIQKCDSTIASVSQQDAEKDNSTDKYLELQKQLEEFEKVEQEWENGENWEEVPPTTSSKNDKDNNFITPKPPRAQSNDDNELKNVICNVQDWRQISMFMPPWDNENIPVTAPVTITDIPIETTSCGTTMELGDFNQAITNFKVISATPRDINIFHIASKNEKIPDKRMLDKSTVTNEQVLTEASRRCLNEEKHFSAFRKLFKNINKTALRDIFDQCMGDVNWAVEIVLDGMAANQIETVNDDQMSDEDISDEACTCLSAYHIVPDTSPPTEVAIKQDDKPVISLTAPTPKKVSKRDVTVSDASVELKRQIEQNVVISQNHYSEHCLKIMRYRRGYPENVVDENQPSTSELPQQQNTVGSGSGDEEESNGSAEYVEKTVNINLGKEFVAELDMLFGRTDMCYPDSLVPKINIPMSLLNEINALWMESLMYQLDEHERQKLKMLQEDEDFAKALALKEDELSLIKKEPEVLDFKEIMDMDLALSIYQRDVAEWRNKEPNDLAAKLTREKLYSLFPDVSKDILAELLMAHDNNFQSTVEETTQEHLERLLAFWDGPRTPAIFPDCFVLPGEIKGTEKLRPLICHAPARHENVLLVSTGKASLLKQKNGVNKFVMDMEMERRAIMLEAERKALSEVEWPLLPKGEVPDMNQVTEYRSKADRHLHSRNINIQKANDYLSRGMLNVASYYRELAEFHKLKFEQFNSMAAASLMQIHAANSPDNDTIDLHYLRVGEAKESLDLFIDMHIQKLKSNQGRGARQLTLYLITGRGIHSPGGPRIKPAVKNRLRERGLSCGEMNPGLLSTRVTADDKLSHEIA